MKYLQVTIWTTISAVANIMIPIKATLMTGFNFFHPEFIAAAILINAAIAFCHAFDIPIMGD